MTRRPFSLTQTLRALARATLLVGMLFGPLAVAQSVQAASDTIIEDSSKIGSGAGLVLVISLQRS